jgi:hypothetical protein
MKHQLIVLAGSLAFADAALARSPSPGKSRHWRST